jgi:hypothetical protein
MIRISPHWREPYDPRTGAYVFSTVTTLAAPSSLEVVTSPHYPSRPTVGPRLWSSKCGTSSASPHPPSISTSSYSTITVSASTFASSTAASTTYVYTSSPSKASSPRRRSRDHHYMTALHGNFAREVEDQDTIFKTERFRRGAHISSRTKICLKHPSTGLYCPIVVR